MDDLGGEDPKESEEGGDGGLREAGERVLSDTS